MLHVIFTPDGIPSHISADPRPGSEPVEGLSIAFLAAHRRTATGEWVKRDPVIPPEPTPEEAEAARLAALADAKTAALARVNEAVQALRLRLVTPLPGQDAIYTQKAEEAARYVATSPEPDTLDGFPFLAAEVGITAPTAWQLAQIWLHLSALFATVGAATEGARKSAEAAIAAAPDLAAVTEAEAAFAAALAKLPV